MDIYALIAASGSSTRMGENKLLLPLGDSTVIETAISHFVHPSVRGVVLVTSDEEVAELGRKNPHVLAIVSGSCERWQSVMNGLEVLPEDSYVLVHDGARPFLSEQALERALEAAGEKKNFFLGIPLRDTIKEMKGDVVFSTPSRDSYVCAQTPQGAPTKLLKQAYQHAQESGFIGTDDCSYLEHLGEEVVMVEGDIANIKITYPEDRRLL